MSNKRRQQKTTLFYRQKASRKANQWQLDLADFSRYRTQNKNFRYLLVAVNVYSRYLFLWPLKSKSKTYEGIDELAQTHQVKRILADQGSEFKGSNMRRVLKKHDISLTMNPLPGKKNRTGMVERNIRTIRENLRTFMYATRSLNWVKYIPDVQDLMNHREMKVLNGLSPHEVHVLKKDYKQMPHYINTKPKTKKLTSFKNRSRILPNLEV